MPRDLLTALSLLPDAYAAAMKLRLDGATPAQVGDALGLDRSAVDPLLQVANAKLRELLLAEDSSQEGNQS